MGTVIQLHPVPDWVKPAAICNFLYQGTLTLSPEHQSVRMSYGNSGRKELIDEITRHWQRT